MNAIMNRISVLLLLAICGACVVVAVRHDNRLEFIRLQELENRRDHLQAEWGRLMLEKATWSAQHSISEHTANNLGMTPPDADEIITVNLELLDGN